MKDGRLYKINAEIHRAVAEIINYELKDPRISGIISVLRVETDNDLYQSVVYISIYNSKDEKETFSALQNCAGFIRKELNHKIKLRTIPMVVFKMDNTMEYSENINKVLSTLDIPKDDDLETNDEE